MMYDNVWHDIVWEGGSGNLQKSPNPIWNQEPGGTCERCLKRSPYTLGLTKEMDDFLKLDGVPKLIEGKTHRWITMILRVFLNLGW